MDKNYMFNTQSLQKKFLRTLIFFSAVLTFLTIVLCGRHSVVKAAEVDDLWFADYVYVINTDDNTIFLKRYIGENKTEIFVPSKAVIGDVEYSVEIKDCLFMHDTWHTKDNGVGGALLKKVEFDDNITIRSGYDLSYLFSGCFQLEYVKFGKIIADEPISMENMFYSCGKLKEVDFSGLNEISTNNTKMMFYDCESLEDVEIPFGADCLKSMNRMFYNCKEIKKIKFNQLNTNNSDGENPVTMDSVFANCSKLKSVDISPFDMSNVLYDSRVKR